MTPVFTRLKELWDATTEGEWHSCEKFPESIAREFEIRCGENPGGTLFRSTSYGTMQRDSVFIAYAHNNVPAMLAEVEWLRSGYLADENGNEYVAVCVLKEKIREIEKENTELKLRAELQLGHYERANRALNERIEKMERGIGAIRKLALYCLGPTRDVKTPKIQEIAAIANQILGGGDEK